MLETEKSNGEIFEGFGGELSELKDFAVLIPDKQNFTHIHTTDTILKWLDPILSLEFKTCTTFEKKMEVLFKVKDKWTAGEFERYMKNTLEPEQSM